MCVHTGLFFHNTILNLGEVNVCLPKHKTIDVITNAVSKIVHIEDWMYSQSLAKHVSISANPSVLYTMRPLR